MKSTTLIKISTYICMITMLPHLTGCADHAVPAKNGETYETQNPDQKSEEDNQEIPAADAQTKSDTAAEKKKENGADSYAPVAVTQMDYNLFQSRMTEEEWEGFQLYFPVLKENASFELAGFDYDKKMEERAVDENGRNTVFYRYDCEKVTDLSQYMKAYADGGIEEMMIYEVQVFDLDEDGIRELILYWGYTGNVLVLHRENDGFYGWETVGRGFQVLRTNGIYLSSGGASVNCWNRIRYNHGSWIQETLAEQDWDTCFIGGEPVEETAFRQQIDAYKAEDVGSYKPETAVR